MRSYTNREGETIQVSDEHLDKAVEIKIQLQESNPSRKCNWNLHKKMMEDEKIYTSDTNESYRCLVKAYQKSIGKLASVQDYAEMVSTSKLQAIKVAVGELYHEKRENQIVRNELNKVKRQLSSTAITTEEVVNSFIDDIDWTFPNYVYEPRFKETASKLILVIGDWHVGATVVDSKDNNYNFKVALDRIDRLKGEVIKYLRMFNITEVIVVNVGDTIEGLYMRSYNQPFEAEFNVSEQISKSTKLIMDLLISLSAYANVSYFGIAGNHDRWFFEKNTVDSDNAMKVINGSIKTMIELSNTRKLSYIEVDELFNYEKVFEVNGKKFKAIHGNFESQKNLDNIEKHIALEQEDIDCLIMGHWHQYKAIEGNYGKWTIINGSLMGRNNFSRKFKGSANASQSIIIVSDEIIPIKIDLQSV